MGVRYLSFAHVDDVTGAYVWCVSRWPARAHTHTNTHAHKHTRAQRQIKRLKLGRNGERGVRADGHVCATGSE